MMDLNSIDLKHSDEVKNTIMCSYYEHICVSKSKTVALSAFINKLCNVIFSILRDSKPFEIISPK